MGYVLIFAALGYAVYAYRRSEFNPLTSRLPPSTAAPPPWRTMAYVVAGALMASGGAMIAF